MKGQKLIIKFEGKFGYLADEKALPFQQLRLSDKIKERGFKPNTIWELTVLKYIPSEKRIYVRITSYNPPNPSFSSYPLSNIEQQQIEEINFEHINTHELIQVLNPIPASPLETIDKTQHKASILDGYKLEEAFFIPIRQIQFKDGHVLFEKKISRHNEPILFKIENEHILEAFDAIKEYFTKAWKTSKAKVKVTVEIFYGAATVLEVHSPEIQGINEKLIEQIRIGIVRSFLRKKHKDNQTINTADEFFSNFSEGKLQTKTFYDDEMAFFEELMKIQNAKHYKHLRYLSGKHANGIMKLRFVVTPLSFIFLVEGKGLYHIIWETLKTEEATYIWQVEKDIKKLKTRVSEVNGIINSVKIHGKRSYIHAEENRSIRIFHDYSDSDAGFKKWKKEMETVFSNPTFTIKNS